MTILITGKKFEIGDSLRADTENKIHLLSQKYDLHPIETTVVFSKDSYKIRCDVEMHLGRGLYVRAHKEAEEAYGGLDEALDTFEKRLRRHKGKLIHRKRHEASHKGTPALHSVINPQHDEISEEESKNPLIIAEVKVDIPTLTVSEAVMHLDLSNEQAVLFHNAADTQLNVVYWRPDGNIGWVAPSPQAL